MSKRRSKQRSDPSPPVAPAATKVAARQPHSRAKLWSFRLAAGIVLPILLVALIELTLRMAGAGYPTSFLLAQTHRGNAVFVQNNQFGWRFFGRDLARWPYPLVIPQTKPANTVRIFVLGESAARGEPQPDFGLSRVLEAMLHLRHPQTRFEVVNAAMTAINSHAILPIARDCARADGDIWVIYMGNNEVVGPFGAGTVFGAQIPPLPLIRAGLTARSTRLGQVMESVVGWLSPSQREQSTWGGMTMFLDQQVRADDPRMERVYEHFRRNLEDIIATGRRAGVGLVISTVAVNLRDCPPFASQHRPDLGADDVVRWNELYQRGSAAQAGGAYVAASGHFAAASRLDDTYAELRFRQGQCALAAGDPAAARAHFEAARDLDTLRFRCDARLNDIIRRTATNTAGAGVLLVDAERALAEQSPSGLPGEETFYEHVHFTFAGNYRLARTIAEQVEHLLDSRRAGAAANDTWPTAEDCAQRLGRSDWHEVGALNSIVATLNDPPFSGQLDHAERLRRFEIMLGKLMTATRPIGIAAALQRCEAALRAAPDDPVLHKSAATLRKFSGDLPGAAAAARRGLELLPSDSEGWSLLGTILAQQGQLNDAAAAFQRAFQVGPQGIKSALELAGALASLGRDEEAMRVCQRVLRQRPRHVPALLQLGLISEKLGRKGDAEDWFQQALSNRSQRLPELLELGDFFQRRGMTSAAMQVYEDALRLNPSNAMIRVAAGRNLASMGRFEEAARHATEAVRLAPELVEARLLHGITLFRRGAPTEAMAEFETALRLQPESLDARVNLGMALMQQGRRGEALTRFREVLQRDPTNVVAQKFVQVLDPGPAAVEFDMNASPERP